MDVQYQVVGSHTSWKVQDFHIGFPVVQMDVWSCDYQNFLDG